MDTTKQALDQAVTLAQLLSALELFVKSSPEKKVSKARIRSLEKARLAKRKGIVHFPVALQQANGWVYATPVYYGLPEEIPVTRSKVGEKAAITKARLNLIEGLKAALAKGVIPEPPQNRDPVLGDGSKIVWVAIPRTLNDQLRNHWASQH